MSDAIILSEGQVSVDNSSVKAGNQSYSVSSIKSVYVKEKARALVGFLIGALIVVSIISCAVHTLFATMVFLIGAVAIAKAVRWNDYSVIVKNSSGDQPVLTTGDKEQATRLQLAIETAIRLRK